MARIPLKLEQLINLDQLQAEFETIAGDGNAPLLQQRKSIIACLKKYLKNGYVRAEELLLEDGSGTACAKRLSQLMDIIIRLIFDFSSRVILQGQSVPPPQQLTVVAIGGYGRGTLAPGSDVDLLFLVPAEEPDWSEKLAEYILYIFWDLGLKLGYSIRNVDECIAQAEADITTRTALMESRLICGDDKLYHDFDRRFDQEIIDLSAADYIHSKLEERDQRHSKHGESRYVVEPNVKDGKGGLRDLHTLFWIGKYYYRVRQPVELVDKGVFTRREYRQFEKAEDFLWAVRCHMHFLTGKAEERLHFDIQRDIAERLGYVGRPGLSAVERFMKHYFLNAKIVGDLTRIFCSALEEEQAKPVPGFNLIMESYSLKKRKLAGTSDFMIDNHRITIADDNVFERDPVNMLRLFWFADRHGLEYHPDALKLLTRSLHLIDKSIRRNDEANALFMDILTSSRDPELNMRRMNEAGLLGKLIPDFNRIVAMMQFSMYHHYTVDEHLIRCIGVLSELEHGEGEAIHPLTHSLLPGMKIWRNVLYTAVLFHDIAKGRPENHSTAGAKIARRLCPFMGFDAAETETIAWLIEQHLTMSMIAQTRDLHDRKTIQDFADIVQSVERLKLLLILTVCDIRGVGPGVWNGWKGQLLRTLYYETELLLTGGFSEASRTSRATVARENLAVALEQQGWSQQSIKDYIGLHYSAYLLATDIEEQIQDAAFIQKADQDGTALSIVVRPRAFEAVTEITILAPDHPRLLSIIAGACAATGANIVDAQIFTTTDGRALDTILISREFEFDTDEMRRAKRVGRVIEDVLTGREQLSAVIAKRTRPRRGAKAFRAEPRAEVRNTLSNRFSVIEIECLDRPGLLSEVTHAISDLSLDIASAHISTFGEMVIDTFYVNDLAGTKIEDPDRLAVISKEIMAVLQQNRIPKGNSQTMKKD